MTAARRQLHFAILLLLLIWELPVSVHAQFSYSADLTKVTILKYTGPGGDVTIPDTIDGLPVRDIGPEAFADCQSLTNLTIGNNVLWIEGSAFARCFMLRNVSMGGSLLTIRAGAFGGCTNLTGISIPNSVVILEDGAFGGCISLTNASTGNGLTTIGGGAFSSCTSLTSVAIGDAVTNIDYYAFGGCARLTSVTIPDNVISIGGSAFSFCTSLTNVTIGKGVTSIAHRAFDGCVALTAVYFRGNAPTLDSYVFEGDNEATVYYLPGAMGWGTTFGGRPTALWKPQVQTGDSSFGVQTNQFGFNIAWASGMAVVVEACTNLASPAWSLVGTNTLTADSFYFSDPEWTNYPGRFYRLRSP